MSDMQINRHKHVVTGFIPTSEWSELLFCLFLAIGKLFVVYPASRPMTAGIGFRR